MEAKSPFEEIFSSKKEKREEEKKEENILDFNPSESGEPVPLDTGDRYLNLIVELLKNKYFFEAIEVIKEMASEGV